MTGSCRVLPAILATALVAAFLSTLLAPPAPAQTGAGGVVYVPTPQVVVDRMLALARVGKSDFVADLGSGDGRIVITAAKQYGARGLGVDLDPVLVRAAAESADRGGVTGRVQFQQRDLYGVDLAAVTVVTAYLHPDMLLKLRPKLLRELRPGARIVSHDYHFREWRPDASVTLNVPEKKVGTPGVSHVYLWVVPANVHGIWRLALEAPGEPAAGHELALVQDFQKVDGVLRLGAKPRQIAGAALAGARLKFTVASGDRAGYEFSGEVRADAMAGEVSITRGATREVRRWTAKRVSPARQIDGS